MAGQMLCMVSYIVIMFALIFNIMLNKYTLRNFKYIFIVARPRKYFENIKKKFCLDDQHLTYSTITVHKTASLADEGNSAYYQSSGAHNIKHIINTDDQARDRTRNFCSRERCLNRSTNYFCCVPLLT